MGVLTDVAKPLFDLFGKAVGDYPLPTLITLFSVFSYLQAKKLCLVFDIKSGKPRIPRSAGEVIFGITGIIATVLLANCVGRVFNLIEGCASPFAKHPVDFTVIFLALIVGELLYFSFKTGFRLRRADPVSAICLTFCVLFGSYVFTSIYAGATGDQSNTDLGSERGKAN